ncbi:hypothetical protein IE53DRAFT_317190 [Violaceomyces palustris]|uniref:Uncharacterized protein n=1 Tax=Violaceomyces palustris TaxID=1673888 RepID=A0ACD0NV67_9BASI|nr:hypothetical protein IE53DRAFT_317190 [Violaceomyces palustris]
MSTSSKPLTTTTSKATSSTASTKKTTTTTPSKATSSSTSTKVATTSSSSSSTSTSTVRGSSVSSSSQATSTTSSAASPVATSGNSTSFGVTPPLGKAGVAGGQSLPWTASSLGWYYDWSPNPDNPYRGNIQAVPALWGLGRVNHDNDVARFQAFQQLKPGSSAYVIGYNEPDWEGEGSSGVISPQDGAKAWDQYIAPHGVAGSILISPSLAKQKDEDWMQPFLNAVQRKPDAINVHIFQNSIEGVKGVVEHYAKYALPMWITEFACINYQVQPTQYCDQNQTNTLINQAVSLFQSDPRIAAFAISDAYNGPYSALTPNHDGTKLSETGETYLAAVKATKTSNKK